MSHVLSVRWTVELVPDGVTAVDALRVRPPTVVIDWVKTRLDVLVCHEVPAVHRG